MAIVNKVMLIGRLTREPESRTFANGGKMAFFGFAVSTRRKNPQTGQWENGEAMFIDCKVFNRGDYGKKADTALQYLHKGHQAYLEGKLVFEQWDDKQTGQKRSKHVLEVEDFQMLEPRQDGGSGGTYQRQAAPAAAPSSPMQESSYDDSMEPALPMGKDASDDIPF